MSDRSPTVSAVIVCWNGRRFLPDLLRTLSADLAGLSHEIILVDNGSHDDSVSFVQESYPEVIIIENGRNLGFAAAANVGLRRAGGDFVFLLNQDLRIRPGCTRALLDRLQRDPRIGLIGPKLVYFDGRLQRLTRGFPSYRHVWYHFFWLDRLFPRSREFGHWRMTWFDHESEMAVEQPMGAAVMIPRPVLERVGLFDESFPLLFNDVDLCRRIHDAGYILLYYPGAVVEHYVGASTSRIPYRLIVESHRSMYRYLRKHARPRERLWLWLTGLLLYVTIPLKIAVRFLRRLMRPRRA